jgi:integrase
MPAASNVDFSFINTDKLALGTPPIISYRLNVVAPTELRFANSAALQPINAREALICSAEIIYYPFMEYIIPFKALKFPFMENNMIDDILAKFDGAFAKNTIRAYRSDFIQYQIWCSHNNIDSIPATSEAMAQYVDYLATIKKSATIRRRINSLGTVLKLSKNHDPTKQPEVALALKRMHRKIGRAQEQATPLTKSLLNQLLNNCDNSIMGIRNQVLLRLGYETMRRRSELCNFKYADVDQTPNGKPIMRLNFSKTDQYGAGKILPISEELIALLEKWEEIVGEEGYILRSINRHGQIGKNLNPASISTILKALQIGLGDGTKVKSLSGHSFRVGAALDLLEQGEPLERIMLRGGWQSDSTALTYLRNWCH